jgi:hypothetical protein
MITFVHLIKFHFQHPQFVLRVEQEPGLEKAKAAVEHEAIVTVEKGG